MRAIGLLCAVLALGACSGPKELSSGDSLTVATANVDLANDALGCESGGDDCFERPPNPFTAVDDLIRIARKNPCHFYDPTGNERRTMREVLADAANTVRLFDLREKLDRTREEIPRC